MMKKTLVFGASLNPTRYSNLAIRRLVDSGIETQAYGLGEGEVSGVNISNNFNDSYNYAISKSKKAKRIF